MDNSTLNNRRTVLYPSLLIKLFTILIFSLFAPKAFAQLDLIHYVPPLYEGTYHSKEVGKHWVVLTTPSEEKITVEIRKGNGVLLASVSGVSKTTPKKYVFGNGSPTNPPFGVINYKKLNTIISDQGLIFTSTQAFYVNIRHKSEIHGLSLTAKGQAALGKNFRSGHLYSKWSNQSMGWSDGGYKYVYDHRSHFISVMATEDNTQVTFSDIKVANLTSNTKNALPVTGPITVNLNAGQSYVIGANFKPLNTFKDEANALNGTHITSDKPIAVNTGSWCGGSAKAASQDIGVDQIVPEKLVGQEYILLKGKGNSETERPIVVATKDNTQIRVNSSSAVIHTLSKAGDYYAIPSTYYKANGVMLIKTTENAYLYQTTSASSVSSTQQYATVGMNFIPPLSALGFRQVDIPFVNELGTGVIAIYAQKGAKVYVNGSGSPLNNPLDVNGNNEWVVYSYSTSATNVTVESDKAIYVAMSVEDIPVGAAGYFSGFTKSISPIDTTLVFNYDLGYICSSQEGNLDLAINSKPIPDWYEWYHDIVHPDSIKFKNQNLNIPIPDAATKYILKAYFRDPNMDILYNGDFAIGWGSSATSLDPFKPSNLEDLGKVTLTANPESINSKFENFTDLDGVGRMLLAHSRGGHNDVIWEQTINSSTDIPDNLFVLKVYGRLAEAGTNQYLNIYVNDELVYEKFNLDDVTKWKSIKAYWRAGSSESANLKIVDANASGSDAVFAIDSISFVPAIEATKEFNPAVVPSYTYNPYDKGLHLCKGEAQGIADISYGDMGWFTFLWEKQELDGIYEPITDPNITGQDTYKLVFNNVVNGYAGTYRCTIGFRTDYEECGIGADPTSVLVEVTVDDPATLEPLKGKTKLCYGVSSEISTVVSGDFSLIRWTVYKDGETTPFGTLENNSSSYDFNKDRNYATGKYKVRCEVVNGCSTDLYEDINIEIFGRPSLTSLDVPTNLCDSKPVDLTANGSVPSGAIMEYSWYRDNTLIETTNSNIYNIEPNLSDTKYKVGVAARYKIDGADDLVCTGNEKSKILVAGDIYPELKFNLPDVTICEGLDFDYKSDLKVTGDDYTYLWETPASVDVDKTNASLSLKEITPGMAGNYKLTVTDRCETTFSDTGELTITPKLDVTDITIDKKGPYCDGDVVTITIDALNADYYMAENITEGQKQTINPISSPFVLTVNADNEGVWRITAVGNCGAKYEKLVTVNILDAFSDPYITDTEACVGENKTLETVVTTPPVGVSLKYQWKDQLGNEIVGATSSTLEFKPVKLADAGEYTCVVRDGVCTNKEAKGTLSVDDITSTLKQGTVNVCEGTENYRFDISYEGTPTFTWYYKGADDVEIDLGRTDSFYEIPTVTTDKAGLYYCVINSACGDELFEQTLNVLKQVTVTNDASVKLDICEGTQTELKINVTGTPNSIKWFDNSNAEVTASRDQLRLSTGKLASGTYTYRYELTGDCNNPTGSFVVHVHKKPSITVSDVTGCEGDIPLIMTVTGTDYSDPLWLNPDNSDLASGLTATIVDAKYLTSSGNYTAKISTDFCGEFSTTAKVNVLEPVSLVSNSELNPHVCLGKSLSLKVEGKGDALSYKWYKGATLLSSTENTLDITSAKISDEGNYRCQLVSTCENVDVDFVVDVRENATVSLLNDVTVCEDDTFAEFSVTGTAEDSPSYQWYNSDNTALSNAGDFSGVTTSTLKIVNVLNHENKSFYCVVSGDYCTSAQSRSAKLSVGKNVDITHQPGSISIQEKGTASFSVDATGTPSASETELTYQWFVNTGSGFTSMGNTPTSAQLKTLILTDVPLSSDGYIYHCVVTGSCEPATSDPAILSVSVDNRITSTVSNAKACEGSSFMFTVGYNNTTDDCTWEYDDGSGYADASGLGSVVNGTTSSTLTVTTATTAMETDSWKFRARVLRSGYDDNLSNEATVTVYEQVVISDISNTVLCPNLGGSFNVNTTAGTEPYTYEWTRVSTGDVLGSSSNLSLSVSEAVSEEYNVKVSNTVCPDVNKKFTISRYPDLVLTDLAHTSPLCIDDDINLSAVLTEGPASAATYVWTKDGSDLSEPSNSYSKLNVTTGEKGIYKVVVTDECTSKTSSVSIDVLDAISLVAVSSVSQDVCEGEPFDLQVKGTGDALVYNWYKIDALGGSIVGASLSTDKNYHVTGLSTTGANYYRCVLSSIPDCTQPELDFTVNVQEKLGLNPLAAITICEDLGSSEFAVTTSKGTPLSYQWYDNDTEISGETNANLFVDNVLTNNGHNYHVVVVGACNSVKSNKALFTVNENVTITTQPVDVSVVDLGTTSFSVVAYGTGSLTYQWFENTGSGFVNMGNTPASAQTSELVLTNVPSASDGNLYRCEVSGTCDPATSEPAKLTVNTSIKITENPKNTQICEGSPFSFEVKFKNTVTSCVWQYDDGEGSGFKPASSNSKMKTNPLVFSSGDESSVLTIDPSTFAMNGYQFRAFINGVEYSSVAKVAVYQKVVVSDISDETLCLGTGKNFIVNVTAGTSPYTYEWKKGATGLGTASNLNLDAASAIDGTYSVSVTNALCPTVTKSFEIKHHPDLVFTDLTHASPLCLGDEISLDATATSSAPDLTYAWTQDGTSIGSDPTYGKLPVEIGDRGIYKVIVKDKCTSKTSSVSIDVLDAISLARVSPESQNVCEGEPFDLQVQGTGDALVYNWYKLDGPSGTLGASLSTDKNYHVAGLSTTGANYYRCVLSTTYGCTPDELNFTVNVQENVSVSDPAAIKICEDGSTSSFSVTASGEEPFTYQWYNNAGEMSGETGSSVSVNNVLANNGQNYYCIVGGTCKSAESNKALFTVNENVTITSQSGNQTINEMGSATFTVDATGTGLSYQWYENGSSMGSTPASAQTNTLSLSSVLFSSNGHKYKCVVTGTCVNATSTEAILTVIKENRILVQAENAVVCEGNPFEFVVQYKNTTTNCIWKYNDGSGYVDASSIGTIDNDATTLTSTLTVTKATKEMEKDSWKFKAFVERTGYDDNVSNEVGVRVDIPATFADIDDKVICNGTGASFSINGLSGSTPHTYTWTEGARVFDPNSSLSLTAAEATDGTYTVGVTAGVCPAVTDPFVISHYDDLVLKDLVHDNTLCPEGKIDLTVETEIGSSVPETYAWSKDGSDILGASTASYEKLNVTDVDAGLYKVTVEDHCMTQSKSIRIDVLDVVAKTDIWTDKTLCAGDGLLFEATVSGDSPVYTWKVPTGVTNPGNVSTYKIDAVTEANEGLYECSVKGTCGEAVVYSAKVVVDHAPNITADLALNPICVGDDLELGPIAYDLTTNTTIDETIVWKFNDDVLPGENGLSLDLGKAELDPSEKGNYRVEVSNVCGADYSIGYQDIYPRPTLEPIDDQTACQGENVVFNAVTTGEDLTYRWFVDDEVVAYTKEFIISDIQPEDAFNAKVYKVECIVSSSCSPDMSETAMVTVNPTTILKSSLKGEVVYVGNEHVFDFNVTGSGLKFEWHHSKVDGTDETLTEATKTLTIGSLSLEDAGEYYCKIKGDCGTRFTSGYLSVKDPLKVITSLSSDDIERCEGEPLNLNISVEGEVFDIQWYYAAIGEEKTLIVGQKELNYSIPALSTENAGTYSCVIIGEGLTVTEEVNVIVYPNTVLNSTLKDQTLCEGEDLSWSADVSGAGLTYTWKHEAEVITTITTSNLLIEGVQQLDDAGLYTVDVEGKCGVVSTDANLTVKMLPLLVSNSDDLDLCENYPEAIFMATFTGDDLQYQWQKDGVDIEDANGTELKILDVRVEDAGDYTCIAISPTCGDATSGIMKLIVTPQLEILSETPGMDVCAEEDAQFEIEVDGNDVKYQWYKLGKEGDPIKGATGINTSQLSIDSVSLSEEGYYYCGVTDKCSTSERYSNPKKLTVNPLPNSKIIGRMTLCVLEDRVAYNTEVTPYNNYGWLVDGGEFTMPAQGDRTKITWGEVVEGSKIGLEILNEETGCSFKLDSAVTLRPLPKVDLAPFQTYGVCKKDDIHLNKGIVNGEAEEGGIYWINGVAENEFIPSERGNGQYNVRYSYTDKYGCSNTSKEFVLTVDSLPIVKIMDDVVVGTCETKQLSATTDEDNIRWSPSLYLDDKYSKTPTFTAGESTLYVAEVQDEHKCWGNDIINVTVAPLPTITTINDTIIGECKEIELKTVISGDIDEISWSNPGDLDEPDNSNPKLINRQVGVTDYQINVTDKYGCIASGSVKVEVLPNPEVGESQNLCQGESLVIDTRDLSNPVWTDGFSDWERTIDEPGEYMLSVEQNGCKLSQKIVMNPTPKFELDHTVQPGIVIFQGQTVTLEPDLNPDFSPYVYDWNDGSILSQLVVSESGVYKLKVQDKFGCVATDTVEVLVKPIGIESPDAFTPLSDNENDRFYLKDINVTDDFKMYVYDRWGELIYEASEPGYAGGWDGTYRGEDCPVGTYVWIVFLDGKEKEKGTVTLLR
ncbi:gliding motility-associated C-terminal domain-containing protein [Ancylomarina sp. 16SWW S1-10-2]|uniref:T9SS type B sorting domain-containing protein n=1 Tax=Ancylomarina sp. 16SWW S1-10-2 TaxID=2499681 RepID=UPI0012AD657E|nr:gliding motility-associated C-terminal domain-containing protein [Ancylomarina sp. 16SWW S1-10-2]MRT91842.1 T9SS type B sorting domain-containing protein [Ancylomarina sp. 16SWW S1-10-2]